MGRIPLNMTIVVEAEIQLNTLLQKEIGVQRRHVHIDGLPMMYFCFRVIPL